MERIEAIRARVGTYVSLFDKLRDASNDPDGTGDFARLRRAAWNVDDCEIMDDLEYMLAIAEAALEWYTVYHDDNSEDGVNRVLVDACRRFREGK